MKGNYLTAQQEKFVDEYLKCMNASAAARKAGYSLKSAHRYCLELLTKPHIRDAIKLKRKELATQSNITCLRTLQEYVSVGFSDLGNIVEQEADGGIVIRDLEAMAPHIRAAVASVSCEKTQTKFGMATKTKITLHPKLDALNNIVRMLGFDKAQLDKELAAQATQASKGQGEPIDPKTLTKDEWELFKKINERKLKALGIPLEGEVHHEEATRSPFEIRASYARAHQEKR